MGNWASRKRWSQQADSQPAGQSSTGGGDDDDDGRRAAKSSLDLSDRPPSNLYNKSMKKVKSTPNISQKSSQNGSVQRQKSLKGRTERPVISSNHPLSPSAREIITSCFDNPHQDIGNRICMRMFEKRGDYQMFIYALGKDKWPEITANLRDFMNAVIDNVGNVDEIVRLSREYGESHVPFKSFGFKPDFWVTMTDAMTTECIYLDGATHQPTDTIAAWSQLISMMFSAVRDGYYGLLRRHRRNSRRFSSNRYKNSLEISTDGSTSSSPIDPGGDPGALADSSTRPQADSRSTADMLDGTMSTIEQEDDCLSYGVQGSVYSGFYRSQFPS